MAIVRTVLPRKGIIQPRHGDNYEADMDNNWSLIDSLLQDSGDLQAAVTAAGTVAVLGSLLAGRLILPGHRFTAARSYPALSLADGPTLRATIGSVLYLTLIALLSLGIATAMRDSATSIGMVLGLLYLFPVISQAIGNPHWQRLLQQIGPMSAGLAIQATTDLRSLPISPWAGLGVLAAWAAAALLAGGLLLRMRDT